MIGYQPSSKQRCQYGSHPMNTGMQLTIAQPASRICSAYHFCGRLRADGQVVDDDVGLRFLQDPGDVGRLAGRLVDDLAKELIPSRVIPRETPGQRCWH